MKRLSGRTPSPATVISVIALFVALGGGAYASVAINQVGTQHLKPGAVRTSDIASQAVTGAKIKRRTIGNPQIATAAVTARTIKSNSVTTDKIQDFAVTGQKIKGGQIGAGHLKGGAVGGGQLATPVVVRSDPTPVGPQSSKEIQVNCPAASTAIAANNAWRTPTGATVPDTDQLALASIEPVQENPSLPVITGIKIRGTNLNGDPAAAPNPADTRVLVGIVICLPLQGNR